MTTPSTDTLTAGELVPGTWTIDAAHSEVGFTVRHLMSKVRGRFAEFSGSVSTGAQPTDSSVRAEIVLSSIDTNQAQRDGHLRSAEIFDAEKHATMTFVSTGVTGDADGYVIHGDLTIKDVTRPVELAAEFLGVATDAYGVTRLGAEATTSINRKDFGIDFNVPLEGGKLLIGDKIDITLTIEATRDAEGGQA